MRDFQNYTKEPGAARHRWWVWSLPVVLVALVVGGAALAYEPEGAESQRAEPLGASSTGWVQRMFGGGEKWEDGPFNVLVLGVDERPESEEEGSRTDTIMLVRVDPETGDVRLLSVPRDLLVEVAPGEKNRINAAYNFGGIEQTITVFEDYSSVDVDHYAVVDFEGFKRVIDAMGGVAVDVEDEIPPKQEIEDGLQTLNGKQSLFYVRYRGTAGGDLDRIRRQQQFVAALRSQAFRWNTVKELPTILRVANRNVLTDLGLGQGVTLGRVLVRRGPNSQMTAQQLQGTPETLENGDQVLVPDGEANEEMLAEFRY
ncbi:MAG: LCP family protein [Actinomycetota bacterium]|jgi:LCP family protein required for cell wall assembly|nr:LCP family protein [Actinomycetota bacterium]